MFNITEHIILLFERIFPCLNNNASTKDYESQGNKYIKDDKL